MYSGIGDGVVAKVLEALGVDMAKARADAPEVQKIVHAVKVAVAAFVAEMNKP